MSGFRGAGAVYLSFQAADTTYGGYYHMGSRTSLEIGPEAADTTSIKSNDVTTYGAVIASDVTPGDDKINMEFFDLNRKNLALAWMGTDSAVSVSGGTATDEVVVAKLDAYVRLVNRKLTAASVVVTNSGGGTTYVENTDYTIDYINGLLYAKSTGAITADQSLKIDYAYGSISGYKIDAHTNSVVNCKLLFLGKNMGTGEHVKVTADDIQITADGLMALLSLDNNFLSAKVTGVVRLPAGYTAPYTVTVTA